MTTNGQGMTGQKRRGMAPHATAGCGVCSGLLGDLQPGERAHPLCAWATAEDWAALRPYLGGDLLGVNVSGM